MPLVDVDFIWYRDRAGYRLVDAEPSDAKPSIHPIFGLPVEPSPLARIGKPQRVVPLGGERITYRPLQTYERLYKAFASLETAGNVLRFTQKYGLLTGAGLHVGYEEVPRVLDHAAAFRKWLYAARVDRQQITGGIGTEAEFAKLRASLVTDASGMLSLRIAPDSLLGALWLQLAMTLAGGEKTIRACRQCGKWFETGVGTGRRLDAQFCSDQHRVQFNNAHRTKGR